MTLRSVLLGRLFFRALGTAALLLAPLVSGPSPAGAQGVTMIIDSSGDGNGNLLGQPRGIAADGDRNVFVTGFLSDNVFRVTPDGTITQVMDATGDGSGNVVNGALFVATDGGGNAFVTASLSNNVFKIMPNGGISEIIDSSGDGVNALSGPSGVATDESGNVFVAGRATNNVFKIDPLGTITQIADSSGDGLGNPLEAPGRIATDPSGNLFVSTAEIGGSGTFKISPGGEIEFLTAERGDIAADPLGNLFLTPDVGSRVYKITPSGEVTVIFDQQGPNGGPTAFAIHAVAADRYGQAYALGQISQNVIRITPTGLITEILDSTGDGAGNTFNTFGGGFAGAMATDLVDNVYAAGGSRVFRIDRAPLTKSQQLCVRKNNQGVQRLTRAVGLAWTDCVKEFALERVNDVPACVNDDGRGRQASAENKLAADFANHCTGVGTGEGIAKRPLDIVGEPDSSGQAARAMEKLVFEKLFDADASGVLLRSADKDGSTCQAGIAKQATKCVDTMISEFNRCKRSAIKAGAGLAEDLIPCVLADPAGKIAKACDLNQLLPNGKTLVDKLRKQLERCVDQGVDLASVLPVCGVAGDVEASHACVEPALRCAACNILDEADALGSECEVLDNGMADGSCTDFVPLP